MEGYADLNKFITIAKGKTTTHPFRLKKNYAGLKVTSDPEVATVYFDGEDLGTTPIDRNDLSPGEVTLIIELGWLRIELAACTAENW